MRIVTIELFHILYEDTGDFSGAKTFQGGPFGYGGTKQIPNHEFWDGLRDREKEEKEKNNPNLPKDIPQDELYDLLEPEHATDSPQYVTERHPSDILYRDLPGFPRVNTLANKVAHVPEDAESEEEERYAAPKLIPRPREDARGVPFGRGKLTPPGELRMNISAYGPGTDSTDDNGNELRLTGQKKLGRVATSQQAKGATNRDVVSNHLVKPVNWIEKEFGQTDYKKELEEEDDVPTQPGRVGSIVHPVKHVPGNVDIYSKSKGYMRETISLAALLDV